MIQFMPNYWLIIFFINMITFLLIFLINFFNKNYFK